MLKKIVLVALFVASTTVAAASTVLAYPTQKAPVPAAPKGFCPITMICP
jgi:hypothetical protein